MLKLGFIGAGTVGSALAIKLSEKGYSISGISSRRLVSAEQLAQAIPGCRVCATSQEVSDVADLVFITTPDGAIPVVVKEVRWHPGQSVVHCSGADSAETLSPARQFGAQIGAFHPLQTFASVKQAIDNIAGSTFAIEAEEPLKSTLIELTTALNGTYIELKASDKVIYHAAAVIVCNYLVTLVKLADDLWQTFGVSRDQATKALLPLLKGTLNNIESVGIPQALTGPIARGDVGTIKKHIEAMRKEAPDVLSTYCELGLQAIHVALAKGRIDENKAAELRTTLKSGLKQKIQTEPDVKPMGRNNRDDVLPVL
jgi:predicted short-subunit dehydrogenase-like oxidoreductase (DUF2520 family)